MALPPIHPGRILADELVELGMSANALARAMDVPANRITEILNGRRAITADTALRLAHYFGISAKFWLNLQQNYDLAVVERDQGAAIARAVRPRAA
ncbi:MAG: HigA family addiction module antidote protein [Rhodospirillales bacterium]|nr:HigA family addiction module antidote protein [Rhodospirillales bacterium]